MAVWALGLNHTTAPVDLRGRFAFAIEQIAPALSALRGVFGEDDLMLVKASRFVGLDEFAKGVLC